MLLTILAIPGVAAAYPNDLATYPTELPRTDCVDCHSAVGQDLLDPDSDLELLASVRKGPHGSYTSGTDKCQTCHRPHDAPVADAALLPANTIAGICESCHDGTGGTGVYGVIKARTGVDPVATHRIGQTNAVPGGNPAGGSATVLFSGAGDTLTCNDCHSPHDSGTVEPFVGDRLRSLTASDTAYATKTNRLLRQRPTGADSTVTTYGAGWCAACHKGRLGKHSEESGAMQTHPVLDNDSYTYDELPVVTGVGAITTEMGSLGQSNRGYVMPGPTLSDPTQKTVLQEGAAPICQQCHEDARNVGPSARKTNPTLTSAEQEFRVTTYGADASPTDNPRFQTFPHESDKESFLVRAPEPAEPHSLCLSCHSLMHTATPGSGYVQVFDQKHDDVSGSEDGIDAACTACHVTDLLPAHADQCVACHPTPYDTLDPSWGNSCQQGGCHTTYHDGPFNAHWDAYDTQPCSVCHPNNWSSVWWPTITECLGCHASADGTAVPVTSSNAQASYAGAGRIDFSITKAGKAAIGTTFYRINGGAISTGSSVVVSTPGTHSMEFWSIDQNGLAETPAKTATFTVSEDTTPPVTTSNAQDTYYYYNATIKLTATDASSAGVKATYYRLDGGSIQTGTSIGVPAVDGIVAHTLEFWSEDWAGNIEPANVKNFTIVRQTGTIRLVWGNADVDGQPGPAEDESVSWTVRLGGATGSVVSAGSDTGAGWTGVNDILVPVRATPYWVQVNYWYWEYLGGAYGWELIPASRTFTTVSFTTSGEVVRLSY